MHDHPANVVQKFKSSEGKMSNGLAICKTERQIATMALTVNSEQPNPLTAAALARKVLVIMAPSRSEDSCGDILRVQNKENARQ
jgi:hypothetical protein